MELAPDRVQQELHERVGVNVGVGLGVSVEVSDHRVDGALVSDGHDPRVEISQRPLPLTALEESLLGLVGRPLEVIDGG